LVINLNIYNLLNARKISGNIVVCRKQIFIDNEGIGGCDDLYTLENENKLDSLLN